MEIKVATTMDELKEIAALRYDVYVREKGHSPPFADTTVGLLLEPVDAFNESTVAYVQEDAGIVASIRVEHRIPDWLLLQLGSIPGGFFSLRCCLLSRAFSIASVRGERYFDALNLWLVENVMLQTYELVIVSVSEPELIDLYIAYSFQPSQLTVTQPNNSTGRLLALLACSDGVRGTRLRSFAGRFKHELSTERKAELYRWLKL